MISGDNEMRAFRQGQEGTIQAGQLCYERTRKSSQRVKCEAVTEDTESLYEHTCISRFLCAYVFGPLLTQVRNSVTAIASVFGIRLGILESINTN